MPLEHDLQAALQERRLANLYRQRKVLDSAQSAQVDVGGHRCVNFCSNDYLGLANHPDVAKAFTVAAERYGVGSGASHLVCGHSHEHHALEEELADFTGRPRALLFSTGYMANLGVIGALSNKQTAVFEDKLNHASLLDGGLASDGSFYRYAHVDMAHLESRLRRSEATRKLIVTDGIFSMDGDAAPLPQLVDLANRYDAAVMVDDAHGFGVLGASGGGLAEQHQLTTEQLPVLVGTLGKAFGTFGAFVAGSDALIETCIQFSRSYIYTTALPPAVAAATRASLRLLRAESWRREKLQDLIQLFRKGCAERSLQLMPSSSPIQPLILGDEAKVLAVSAALLKQGFWVSAIRPPTVPKGTARLRFTFSAEHSSEQVNALLIALDRALEEAA